MPEGHAQFCERHIAACVVMTTFRGYSLVASGSRMAPVTSSGAYLQRAGVFFSPATNATRESPRNIAPHRNPSGLPLILRLFLFRNRSRLSLCAAHSAEYYPLATVAFFLRKKAGEFHPCGDIRCKLPLRQPDARMARYFRLFSQFTIILARIPAMTGAAKSCQKAMPSSASVI